MVSFFSFPTSERASGVGLGFIALLFFLFHLSFLPPRHSSGVGEREISKSDRFFLFFVLAIEKSDLRVFFGIYIMPLNLETRMDEKFFLTGSMELQTSSLLHESQNFTANCFQKNSTSR